MGVDPLEIATLFGAAGGLLRHIAQNRGVYWPRIRRPFLKRAFLDLGLFEEILLGAGAGIVVVMGASGSPVSSIMWAIVGGFAGASVLRRKASELAGDDMRYNDNKESGTDLADLELFLREVGYTDTKPSNSDESEQGTTREEGETNGHSDRDS